jgi:DNA-binding NtrC family response regulator
VDVRVIAVTNRDLRQAVASQQFREDLYYRLSMVEVNLPPLRRRPGDVGPLTARFIGEWSERFGKPVAGVSEEAMESLFAHNWPGNVRELENAIGHACMMASGRIELADLPSYLWEDHPAPASAAEERIPLPATLSPHVSDTLEEIELRIIRQALDDAAGNQVRAARLLRTTRDRLRYRMKKYGLMNDASRELNEVAHA